MPKRTRGETSNSPNLLVLRALHQRSASPAFCGHAAETLAACLGYRPELQGLCLPEAISVLPSGQGADLPLLGSSRAFRVKWATRSHVHDSACDAASVALRHAPLLRAILAEPSYMFQRHYALDTFPAGGVVVVDDTAPSRSDTLDAEEARGKAGRAKPKEASPSVSNVGAALGSWVDAYGDDAEVIYDEDCRADSNAAGGALAAADAILQCFSQDVAADPSRPLNASTVRAWVESAPFRLRDAGESTEASVTDDEDADADDDDDLGAGAAAAARARDAKGAVARWRTLSERGERLVATARAAIAPADGDGYEGDAPTSASGGGGGGARGGSQLLTLNEAATRAVPERILSHRIRCVPFARLGRLWDAWRDGSWRLQDGTWRSASAGPKVPGSGAPLAAAGAESLEALCTSAGVLIGPAPDEEEGDGGGPSERLAQVRRCSRVIPHLLSCIRRLPLWLHTARRSSRCSSSGSAWSTASARGSGWATRGCGAPLRLQRRRASPQRRPGVASGCSTPPRWSVCRAKRFFAPLPRTPRRRRRGASLTARWWTRLPRAPSLALPSCPAASASSPTRWRACPSCSADGLRGSRAFSPTTWVRGA